MTIEFTNAAQILAYWQPLICPRPGSEPPPFTAAGVRKAASPKTVAKRGKHGPHSEGERRKAQQSQGPQPGPELPRWRTVTAVELRALVDEYGTWRRVADALGCMEDQAKYLGGKLGVRTALGRCRAQVSDEQLLEAWDKHGKPHLAAKAVGLNANNGSYRLRLRALLAKREAGG